MILERYRLEWAQQFAALRLDLRNKLGDSVSEVHHVGSTAIPGMPAVPVLDIDVEAGAGASIESVSERLHSFGHFGGKAFHFYVSRAGSAELLRRLHFRDSLVASAQLRSDYASLKEQCAAGSRGDLREYRNAKEATGVFARVNSLPPIALRINGAHKILQDIENQLAGGGIDEAEWFRSIQSQIVPLYLAADNPRAQSGHRGDDEHWTRARSHIVEAVNRDGTFLDIGCASGYLMECVVRWAADRGLAVEPYGLDISPELADLARRRLPHWRQRIHVGNALYWKPEVRFDFVRTGLEYVPVARRRDLVAHLLNGVVASSGRLIIGSYNEANASLVTPTLEETVVSWGYPIAGRAERPHHNDTRIAYRTFWIEHGL
jgi:GrpB-like predicted nucleotidyltransferase (UPF0157 family)